MSRWTHRFVIASAFSMVALQIAFLLEAPRRVLAVVGLFGAVLPMVFGMGYLLLPSVVGETLSTPRLPGVHFVFIYTGIAFLLGGTYAESGTTLTIVGAMLWSVGVAIFVGALLRTVFPAMTATIHRSNPDEKSKRRLTRLPTLMLPVAVGYLVVGTAGLLSTVLQVSNTFETSLPAVVHLYGAGFATLLIFALGIRLMTGVFHVRPPKPLTWLVLLCGASAPAVLATNFFQPPWFVVGAGLEVAAMVGYVAIVAIVAYRTERRRVGLYGIGLGALCGTAAVAVATAGVVGAVEFPFVSVHVPLILNGFLLSTIVGYAYQFFPVTNGQFPGATRRTALAVILAVGVGTGGQALGGLYLLDGIQASGTVLTLAGTAGYAYLITRRLLR